MSETCLVTGCAGFVGSHLAEHLLTEGNTVVGVDCFTDQYSRVVKQANIDSLKERGSFEFVEGDLTRLELLSLMEGVNVVYHLAAQTGVRNSWGRDFATHDRNNILGTQLLLEASLHVRRFVYASSANVYGEAAVLPTPETELPRPVSPYGVSKLAGEHLCHTYAQANGIPTVALRLYSVYGPRQRPDMAIHRFIRAALDERVPEVYGDGSQTRDFLYVRDAVSAMVAAANSTGRGEIYNLGSGSSVSLDEVVAMLRRLLQIDFQVKKVDAWRGDIPATQADITLARERLGFDPKTTLEEGLAEEVAWLRQVAAAS